MGRANVAESRSRQLAAELGQHRLESDISRPGERDPVRRESGRGLGVISSGYLISSPGQAVSQGFLTNCTRRPGGPEWIQPDEPEVVDARRGLRRDVHALARHHRRQHGAARDPEGPRRQLHRSAMGDRRLRALARGAGADRGLARRPARPPAGLRDRPRRSSPPPRCSARSPPTRPSSTSPAACRAIGGAIMFAVSLALVAQEFPSGPERGHGDGHLRRDDRRSPSRSARWSAACSPTASAGSRSSCVNVPIGIAAIAVTYWKLAESRDPNATRIDWGGARHLLGRAASCWCWPWCAATTRAGAAPLIVSLLRRRRGC